MSRDGKGALDEGFDHFPPDRAGGTDHGDAKAILGKAMRKAGGKSRHLRFLLGVTAV